MKCPKCKKEIPDYMPLCGYCGADLQGESISDQPTIRGTEDSGDDASVGDMRTMAGKKLSYRKVEVGEEIADRYRIVEVLGVGGMGEVYRCLDMKLNRDVAVKRLLPDMKASKEGIERFLREGQAIAGLNHQNIVQIHDLGEDKQGHYIVMELIEGDTLKKVIRDREEGKLSPEEVGKVAAQIGRGLSYAHRKGVVHRDIKPGNIMIYRDGTAKITDFGLAQVASESELSMTGYGMGTLDYMSPEQRRDAKHTDHRADIYAFGATLYEMTTGKPPRTIRESEIPQELREVILKAMEAKPEERFFSVDEMIETLKKPGKTIEVSESDVKQGACPSCGNLNPMEVKFCEECGAGLFEKCPKCEEEIRIGTKHCGYCGVNISSYKEALDHLSVAKDYIAKHKYSRAKKEYEAVLEIESDNQEAKEGLDDAEGKVGKIHELKEKIEEVRKSGEYEQELESLKELIELIPEDIELRNRIEEIPEDIKKRDLIKTVERARINLNLEDEKNYLKQLLELNPEDEEIPGRLAVLEKFLEHLWTAERYLSEHQYQKAADEYESALNIEGTHSGAREGLQKAKSLIARITDLKERISRAREEETLEEEAGLLKELLELVPEDDEARARLESIPGEIKKRDLIRTAEKAREESRFEDEADALNKLHQLPPDEELNKWVSERLALIPEEIRQRDIENLLKQAKKDLDEGRYQKVLSSCQRVLRFDKGNKIAIRFQISARDCINRGNRKRRIKIGIISVLTLIVVIITGLVIRNSMIKRECESARQEMGVRKAEVDKKINALKESPDKAWLEVNVQGILTSAHDNGIRGSKYEEDGEYLEATMDYKQAASGYGNVIEELTGIAEEKKRCATAKAAMIQAKAIAETSLAPIRYSKAEESRKAADEEYERGQFVMAAIVWEKAGKEYQESHDRAILSLAYNKAKKDYNDKVDSNRNLLGEYGGGKWQEVIKVANEGAKNSDNPVEGESIYRKAILKISGAVKEAEEAKKKSDYEAALKLAGNHEKQKDWDKAKKVVEQALIIGWSETSAARNKLTIINKHLAYAETKKDYETKVKSNRHLLDKYGGKKWQEVMGIASKGKKSIDDPDEGEILYRKALMKVPEAVKEAEEAKKKSDYEAVLKLAEKCEKRKNWGEAKKVVEQALSIGWGETSAARNKLTIINKHIAYAETKKDYETKVKSNRHLLDKYGGKKWQEVIKVANEGDESSDNPVVGGSIYRQAILKLSGAVKEAEDAKKKLDYETALKLAEKYEKRKDWGEAKKVVEQALSIGWGETSVGAASLTRIKKHISYNDAKKDYEKKVKANRRLLDKYGGEKWEEVIEVADEGNESADEPDEGIKLYREALLQLSEAVKSAKMNAVAVAAARKLKKQKGLIAHYYPGNKKIYINTANRSELMFLHGVGPSTADAIIAEREANGLFSSHADVARRVKRITSVTISRW